MEKRGIGGSYLSLVLIIIIVILIASIWFFFAYLSPGNKKSGAEENMILPEKIGIEENMTITQINDVAKSQGVSFCDNIEDKVIKQDCLFQAVYSKANEQRDYTLCSQIANKTMAYECKKRVIFAAVAIKYKEESASNPNLINSSNINLCNNLEVESDKNYCLNPKKMIIDCGGVFCYK